MDLGLPFFANVFSICGWHFALFCLASMGAFFLTVRHLRRQSERLADTGCDIRPVMKKNCYLAGGSLGIVFVGVLLMLGNIISTERDRLMVFVTTFSIAHTDILRTLGHEKLTQNTLPVDPLYRTLMDNVRRIIKSNDIIISAYTLKKDADGRNRFFIAPETDYNHDGKISGELENAVALGEAYDETIPELETAFKGKAAFQNHITRDKWGKSISVFLPIYDSNASVDAVLGIDCDPEMLKQAIAPIQYSILSFGFFFTLLILGGYYLLTQRSFAQYEAEYLVERLNHKKFLLEELNSTLETRIESEVNARQEKERILSHQARLAAMGEMIANITHQWRQPLTAISSSVQDLTDAYAYGELDEHYLKNSVDDIRLQLKQMSSTIDDFREFFSISKSRTRFLLAGQVKTTLMMLKGMLQKHNIAVDLYIQANPEIEGFANEYNHVLINVINNARDVFAERNIPHPKLTITIGEENGKSYVRIADNAGGIPGDIADKIFDPYFTTKTDTHGTGIGLYMCRQIIEENMRGTLDVRNSEDGAVFTISV